MKTKALYIYAGALVIVILAIFLINQNSNEQQIDDPTVENRQMPDDDVNNPHSGMDMPNADNIRPDFMERFNDLKEKYESDNSDTTVARKFASMLSQAHRKGQAIEIYLDILKKDSERIDLLMALAYEFYETKQLDKAEDVTNRIIKLNSENTQAIYNLGSIAIARGDTSKAVSIWQELTKNYPGTEAANVAGNSLSKLK